MECGMQCSLGRWEENQQSWNHQPVFQPPFQGFCSNRCFLVANGDTGVKFLGIGVKLLLFQQLCV